MSTFNSLNVIQGNISILMNGRRFTAPVSKESKFAHELAVATQNGKSPAMALEFLARLAVTHLHPHHCTLLSDRERAEWGEFFGKDAEKRGGA